MISTSKDKGNLWEMHTGITKDNLSNINILMAEDDPDDRFLVQEEVRENNLEGHFFMVNDGVELLDYLHQRGEYNKENAPRPNVILLDLIMPRMDGREALQEIKSYKKFNDIPIFLLTSSKTADDFFKFFTSDLNVTSYISKPVTYDAIINSMIKHH